MIHFNLADNVSEESALEKIKNYLRDKEDQGMIEGYRYLRLCGEGKKPIYNHLLDIVFTDPVQFMRTFEKVESSGIYKGEHGALVGMVKDFHIEHYEEKISV